MPIPLNNLVARREPNVGYDDVDILDHIESLDKDFSMETNPVLRDSLTRKIQNELKKLIHLTIPRSADGQIPRHSFLTLKI